MAFRMIDLSLMTLLAACGSGGNASNSEAPQGAARPLDLAGVSIGMAAPQAEAALQAGGWKLERFGGDTWKHTIDKVVARQRGDFLGYAGDGLGGWNARKGEETLEIQLHPTAGGGRVERVTYRAPIAGRSSAQFRSELARRYGAPTSQQVPVFRDGALWCTRGDAACGSRKDAPAKPHVISAYDDGSRGRVAVFLNEGSEAAIEWNRERDAAVGAAIGKPKTSF